MFSIGSNITAFVFAFALAALVLLMVMVIAMLLQSDKGCKAGYAFRSMFPKQRMRRGSKVYIYMDGQCNRCATITGITGDGIIIYGRIAVPVSYRGRFYATGYDAMDGSRFTYVMCRRHYWLVKLAEFLRKWFGWPEEEGQLPVDEIINVNEEESEDEEQ